MPTSARIRQNTRGGALMLCSLAYCVSGIHVDTVSQLTPLGSAMLMRRQAVAQRQRTRGNCDGTA